MNFSSMLENSFNFGLSFPKDIQIPYVDGIKDFFSNILNSISNLPKQIQFPYLDEIESFFANIFDSISNFIEQIHIPYGEEVKNFFSSLIQNINIIDIAFSQLVKEKLSSLTDRPDINGLSQAFLYWTSEHLITTTFVVVLSILLLNRANRQQPKKLLLGNLKKELSQLYVFVNNSGELSAQQIEERQYQIDRVLNRVDFVKNYIDLIEGNARADRKKLAEIDSLADGIRTRLYIIAQRNAGAKKKGRLPFGL